MGIKRRDFLKAAGGGALALAGGTASARPNRKPLPKAVGMLYDSTLCIGCKACVAACKVANHMPPEGDIWDAPLDLSPKTLNVIKAYRNGTAAVKDREIDGYAFIKRHCMHCVDPGCVSVCPVSAMRKDPESGVVTHHPDACIGCRYCVYACPYDVPKYELNNAFGQIRKCQLCSQRLAKGQVPACVEVCPTGASLFGSRKELLAEAKRRIALKPGETYQYARVTLHANHGHEKPAPHYQQHIFGEKEGGGTQVMQLAGVPFQKLGLPDLPERSYASQSETVQHSLYHGMMLPGLLLAGLMYGAKRSTRDDDHDDSDDK